MADSQSITSSNEAKRQKAREADARYKAKHKDAIAARRKAYRDANREALRLKARERRAANPEMYLGQQRARRARKLEETREYHREWRKKNAEKVREQKRLRYAITGEGEKRRAKRQANIDMAREIQRGYWIKSKYGVTKDQLRSMLESQEHRCKACRVKFGPMHGLKPCIDHDHGTGRVRGLLCRRCNLTLGHAEDNANVLRLLARYLEADKRAQKQTA